jgi:hypothetical protein
VRKISPSFFRITITPRVVQTERAKMLMDISLALMIGLDVILLALVGKVLIWP